MLLSPRLEKFIEPSLSGRYISLDRIEPLLARFVVETIGFSVNGIPIPMLKIGSGGIKVLAWSQMHGNESTTTKAVFDLLNFLSSGEAEAIMSSVTLYLIPMLNPDGAKLFVRENANNIDLNRDFLELSQPESTALMHVFSAIRPNFCFNLHDQRTIYGVGNSGKSTTVAFLAPSYNELREINRPRSMAMEVIAEMNHALQQTIPGMVARFDDAFNRNCVGDTFQLAGAPTILFEAGHFPGDYQRETTRRCIFSALVTAMSFIASGKTTGLRVADYLNIPQNKIVFYDFVYRNVKINYDNTDIITNFAAHFEEELIQDKVSFKAVISEVSVPDSYFGHYEIDACGAGFSDGSTRFPIAGQQANFTLEGIGKFENGILQSNL